MSYFLSTEPEPLKRIKKAFSALPKNIHRFYIAFSGGLDSHVLLHVTHALFPEKSITAIHINHGLQPEACEWEQHCHNTCDALEIPLVVFSVKENIIQYKKEGYSPEDAARKARYIALHSLLGPQDCLLTGHHLEDQAETLLLKLMRGSGITGLGSMRLLFRRDNTYHLRPLLYWDQKDRLDYAKHHQLNWIEDPSNQDQKFMRNFMRHTVVPTLQQHWPNVTHTLQRVAAHCKEASDLSLELAAKDLLTCQVKPHILSIQALLQLSLLRRRNLLRYWLQQKLSQHPTAIQFEALEQLIYKPPHKGSTFEIAAFTIKRYQDCLYFIEKEKKPFQAASVIKWSYDKPLLLPNGDQLTASLQKGKGISQSVLKDHATFEVRFRQGGERFQPQGRIGSHPLKKLFQEWAIPPWKRYQWPLIYHNNQLIAVPGYAVSEKSAVTKNEMGLWISITHSTTMTF